MFISIHQVLRSLPLIVCATLLTGSAIADTPMNRIIHLATTTSTENSGLLAHLLPHFEKSSGYSVYVIAVGTGKALRMGRDGDVDLVLVHAPTAEKAFVDAGYGERRHPVMYNDFVLVGPEDDPASVAQAENIDAALRRIADQRALFLSRGDDSGTHKKEVGLWRSSDIRPGKEWYREAGQGMGKVLQMAGELGGYTLTDRGTWLAYRQHSSLKIQFEGGAGLFNPYGIIAVNPARYPDINHKGASHLIRWITSPSVQRRIGDFQISGRRLFSPNATHGPLAQSGESSNELFR